MPKQLATTDQTIDVLRYAIAVLAQNIEGLGTATLPDRLDERLNNFDQATLIARDVAALAAGCAVLARRPELLGKS